MRVIGLAGGIGTGKSKVAELLAQWGAVIISADGLSRAAVEPGTPGYQAVVAHFGADIINTNGTLNRRRLGERVFADQRARKALEAIVHPWVRQAMGRQINDLRALPKPPPAAVLEIPLLSTQDPPTAMDEIWLITAAEETRIQRVMQRDGLSREEIIARMAAQPAPADLIDIADVIIDNGGAWEQTAARLRNVWQNRILSAAADG